MSRYDPSREWENPDPLPFDRYDAEENYLQSRIEQIEDYRQQEAEHGRERA